MHLAKVRIDQGYNYNRNFPPFHLLQDVMKGNCLVILSFLELVVKVDRQGQIFVAWLFLMKFQQLSRSGKKQNKTKHDRCNQINKSGVHIVPVRISTSLAMLKVYIQMDKGCSCQQTDNCAAQLSQCKSPLFPIFSIHPLKKNQQKNMHTCTHTHKPTHTNTHTHSQ
jgi:hypothetical protein